VNREVHAPFRGSPGVRSPGRPDYAFDAWMVREFPSIPFERYCDDVVVHCGSERQVRMVRDAIAARLAQVGLEMHPDKTRIVYCKDADRRDTHEV